MSQLKAEILYGYGNLLNSQHMCLALILLTFPFPSVLCYAARRKTTISVQSLSAWLRVSLIILYSALECLMPVYSTTWYTCIYEISLMFPIRAMLRQQMKHLEVEFYPSWFVSPLVVQLLIASLTFILLKNVNWKYRKASNFSRVLRFDRTLKDYGVRNAVIIHNFRPLCCWKPQLYAQTA